MFEPELWWVRADSFSFIYFPHVVKENVQISLLSAIECFTLIWSRQTCGRRLNPGVEGRSHQLLVFYEAATLMRQGQARKYQMLLCGIWVKGRDKRGYEELRFMGESVWDGAESTVGGKSWKTTCSEEKASRYFRWRSLHSSLFTVATADMRRIMQVSAVLGRTSSASSIS